MFQLTKEELEQWQGRVYNAIRDISDFELQQKAWYGLTPDIVSSYIEITCTLFDDCAFDEYLEHYKETHGSDSLYVQMLELNNLISAHNPPDVRNDKAILIDTEWIAICHKAKEVCSNWNMS